MQIGLLGKANVGKSTFFSAATHSDVPTGNFPFTTIKPNVGIAHVTAPCPCKDLGLEHDIPQCASGTRLIPVKLIDVAGLVPGAHEGRGLGNRFLDDARQADALIHVVDSAGATDADGQPVAPGTRDPRQDVEFVVGEFDRWFSGILERDWQKTCKESERGRPAQALHSRFAGLGISERDVASAMRGAPARLGDWTGVDRREFAGRLRRASKPVLTAANKADLCGSPPDWAVPCSAETELALVRAASAGMISYAPGSDSFEAAEGSLAGPEQRRALEAMASTVEKLGGTGVQRALNGAVFDLLGMVAAYPVEDESRMCDRNGTVLPDAKLLRPGSTARDLAAAVHEDLAKGFLHAVDCRTGRRMGADHELSGGDVVRAVSASARG